MLGEVLVNEFGEREPSPHPASSAVLLQCALQRRPRVGFASEAAATDDPERSGTVYDGPYASYQGGVLSATGGIYNTTNGGDTWTRAFSGTTSALAVDPARPTTIYAAVGGRTARIARSTDGGRTWTIAG